VTTATAATPTADQSRRTALASHARPARPNALSTSLTFAWRALLKIKHGPDQLADAILIPVLFTVLFTYLLGGALSGSTAQYLRFLLPGTLVMTVLLVTVYAGLGLRTDLTSGVLDRFRSMPIWRPALIVGGLVGDAGRYLLSSAIVIALGLLMGFRADGGVVGVLLAVALILIFAFSLSWIWTTLALLVRTPNAVVMTSFLVQLPLTFASNVFVEPATLPGWLRAFVDVNPVSHLVTTVRELMYGTATAGQVGSVLLVSAALVAVFAPLTMRLYRIKQ
jgi:ABC-2 type transport system permease protein